MAISKILHMKDCGGHFHGKHLKSSLEYIMNPEKTQDGRLIGAVNCQADNAFEQMKETKRMFGKVDKRQGYHMILSFKEKEASPDTAFEITQRFVEEYLGKEYEVVFVVHDNTTHVHSHIVFNSVSFADGKKYRYEKGDWAKDIQPITNKLCREYGLSIIDVEDEGRKTVHENYRDRQGWQDNRPVWSDMIKRDVDACIMQADRFDDFLELLREKGYEVKQGKHLAIKPPGMGRFRRCGTLGADYLEERIQERIQNEDISFYQSVKEQENPHLVSCHIKRYRRAKLSGLQKRYYAKLYQTGRLKKRPYSQAWKYRNDICRMQKLQEQYLFLVRHDIHTVGELAEAIAGLTDKRKESSAEKSRIYKAKSRCRELFEKADEMAALNPAEQSYQNGDEFFKEEHKRWQEISEDLKEYGYTYEEVENLRLNYKKMYADACGRERAAKKELKIGKVIFHDLQSEDEVRNKLPESERDRKTEQDWKDKPKR